MMKKAAPLFLEYFSTTLLKDQVNQDNKAFLQFTVVSCREVNNTAHQDSVSGFSRADRTQFEIDKSLPNNERWKDADLLADDALMFLYADNGKPILPTVYYELDPQKILRENKTEFNTDSVTTKDFIDTHKDRIHLPRVTGDQAWGFVNNKTLHGAPYRSHVEHYYGIEEAKQFYQDDGDFNDATKNAPFLRVSISTFSEKEPDLNEGGGGGSK